MFLARITGSVVASTKVDSMVGQKLVIVEPLRVNEKTKGELVGTGRSFISVDVVGAGEGSASAWSVVICDSRCDGAITRQA